MRIRLDPEFEQIGTPLESRGIRELSDSLLANGFVQPLLVWWQKDGPCILIDGYRRVAAWALLCLEYGKWARLEEVANIRLVCFRSREEALEKRRKAH